MKVAFIGANGKMGKSMIDGVIVEKDMQIVGAVDIDAIGKEIAVDSGVFIENDLEEMIRTKDPDVVVDFTSPSVIKNNIMKVLSLKKHIVVGTTGLSADDLEEIDAEARRVGRVVFVAPNFALGAVLMMDFAARAAKYFPNVEVIELHHDQKKDAPSGTAIKTLEMMAAEREKIQQGQADEIEKIEGSRGGKYEGMRVHSVRLPGYVAHQEVIFGGKGQTLTIRHDSMSRESFVAGLLLSIRSIQDLTPGLVYGLENIL
ncbi:MAG: 4-hydroxy-tetrahydrodipicolinate reductase [Firmicutes bacterium]|nr:4-hydroxy-tetrahydrodipicolinate reductase [Bacillota bacterium]